MQEENPEKNGFFTIPDQGCGVHTLPCKIRDPGQGKYGCPVERKIQIAPIRKSL